jgi:hypothetical protein
MSFNVPNQYRVHVKGTPTDAAELGNNGLFWIPRRDRNDSTPLRVIASDGMNWEHVSVSLPTRCPTWAEMCKVKDMFWSRDDCVMQLHPPEQDWVNNHSFCLHLWRSTEYEIPRPPDYLVGIKEMGVLV